MILEDLRAVDEYNWNQFAIFPLEFWIGVNIDDAQTEVEPLPNTFNHFLGVVAKVAAGARINLNADWLHFLIQHAEEFLRAVHIDSNLFTEFVR